MAHHLTTTLHVTRESIKIIGRQVLTLTTAELEQLLAEPLDDIDRQIVEGFLVLRHALDGALVAVEVSDGL